MLYEVRRLKKSYAGRSVLDIDELAVEQGKVTALLGPNGAGKTTLLKILAFILQPSSGEVRFQRGRVDFGGRKLLQLRRKVVLVQQQPILFTSSVRNNIVFPLRIRRKSRTEQDKITAELLELVGMPGFRHARAHRLSGGETQRVAIARALACFPDIVLLDEPTANVDVENQIAIERIISEISRQMGISVILTTHSMIQASRLAEEKIYLYEGRVAGSGHENVFGVRIEQAAKGGLYCTLQSGLRLRIRTGKPGRQRISINPEGVQFFKEQPARAENTFRGRFVQLNDAHDQVRVLVDVGIPLTALLLKGEFRKLNVTVGETVWLRFPPEAVEVF